MLRERRRKSIARKHLLVTALAAGVHIIATVALLLAANGHHTKKLPKWFAVSKGMHCMQRHKRHRKGIDLPFGI